MKILHLCYYYGNNTSGAPVAAMRLHRALMARGIESHFVCVEKRDEGENVYVLPRMKILNRLFFAVVRVFWVLSKLLTGRMLMPNLMPLVGLEKLVKSLNPDVIHLQYIGQDMLSFSQLISISKPLVFTLHDLTIANAIEAHPRDDTRFIEGFTSENSAWYERWMYARKREFSSRVKMFFTGPSDWICGEFSKSLIGNGQIARMIPNIIDPVYVFDANMRKPHEKFTVLFGAYGGRSSEYKGWPDLEAALALLPADMRQNIRVVVFGESARDQFVQGVSLHFCGPIHNPEEIRRIHHEADVFALPSRFDNAPQVKFEALMDGLPVIAFQRTGCAEGISHRENGWIASDGNCANYAEGLIHFYELFRSGELESRHETIAQKAKHAFAEDAVVDLMCDVYRSATK